MIYYNSQVSYWGAAEHDLMVVPVDCGGQVHRGPLQVLEYRLGGLAEQYEKLAQGNHLTTGMIKFNWRGSEGPVKFVAYLPLAPNSNTPHTFKAWVDCMEDLSAKLNIISNVASIGLPYLPGIGEWEKQEEVILDLFERVSGWADLTLYNCYDIQDDDEVGQEVEGLVMV